MQPCDLNIHKTWNIYICGTLHELENVMNRFLDDLYMVEQYIHIIHMEGSEHSYQ